MSKTPKTPLAKLSKARQNKIKNFDRKLYPVTKLFSDYWALLKGYRTKFFFHTIVRTLANLTFFGVAYYLGRIVDFFTEYNTDQPLTEFYLLVLAIALLSAGGVYFRSTSKLGLKKIAAKIKQKIRVSAMAKMIDLELSWHEKEESGSKIQKINAGGDSIYRGIYHYANYGIPILTDIMGALIIFFTLDFRYLLFGITYMTIYLYGEYFFNKRLSYWQNQTHKINEKVSGKFHESAANLLTVKSLGLKETFTKSANYYEKKFYDIWLKTHKVAYMKFRTLKIFAGLGFACFILLIGLDTLQGIITVGSILAYAQYFQRLKHGLEEVTNRMNDFIHVRIGLARFMKVMDIKTLDKERNGLKKISDKWKKIVFKDISFKYKDKEIIKDFNLTINRGDKIGMVSTSGGGKSTIVKLLLNLYSPQQGKIAIDNHNIQDYKNSSLTKNFSVVLQDSEMFNNTLLRNIAISENGKGIRDMEKIIKISQLQQVIGKLPRGLNTLIGEKGYKLSGGERQRLGIARAAYKGGSLLILDEATSHLDSKTEHSIQKNIEKYMKDKTLLIIAHRLSTLKNTDKIIFMRNGKITEQGSFKELIKMKGGFYRLYKLQQRR